MGDNQQNAAALATAATPRDDAASANHGAVARVTHTGSILASYLRTVLQAYVSKHAHRVPAASSSNAADTNARHAKPTPRPPASPPLPPSKPLQPADRLGEFNSKWNWLKGCRKAARLGKGLGSQSGGESALLLQCEHWLEASDPKHRYGSHLRPYYTHWLEQQQAGTSPASLLGEDFFFWLDEGSGRAVDLTAAGVPRDTLESGRVRYLTFEERARCEVVVGEDGLLRYKRSNQLVDTYDLEETLDDIHMRHSSRTSAQGGAPPPHPAPAGPRLRDAVPTLLQLKTTASTPAPAAATATPPEQVQQAWNGRLRRTLSAPGDGGPMDGGAVELDGLPSAEWLAQQQAAGESQQQQQQQQQQQEEEGQQERQPLPFQAAQAKQQRAEHAARTAAQPSSRPAAAQPAAAARALPAAAQPAAAGAGAAATGAAPGTTAQQDAAQAAAGGPGAAGAAALRQPRPLPGAVAVLGNGKKEKCGWIYVMDTSCRIYVHRKERGQFHHSSFLSGAAVLAAGGLEVRAGHIEKLSAHSGHYRPDEAIFQAFLEYLRQQGADLRFTRILGVSRAKGAGPPPAPVRTALLMRRNSV